MRKELIGGYDPAVRPRVAGYAFVGLVLMTPPLALLSAKFRASRVIDEAVARARELEVRNFVRTAHTPEPGSFRERLELALSLVPAGIPSPTRSAMTRGMLPHEEDDDPNAWTFECFNLVASHGPTGPLPEACLERLAADRAWGLTVVTASRAERWERVPGLSGLDLTAPGYAERQIAAGHALNVAQFELHRRVSAHEGDDALALCIDAIAFARDLSLGSGRFGLGRSAEALHGFLAPCRGAIASASAEKRSWARRALETIDATWPPAGDWISYEEVAQVVDHRGLFTDEQFARLPESARERWYGGDETGLFARFLVLQELGARQRFLERLRRACTLAPAARDAEVAAAEGAERRPLNPLRTPWIPDYHLDFALEDRRHEETRALIDLLK
jgi:hypothetical protein